jgi:hypothetical protein
MNSLPYHVFRLTEHLEINARVVQAFLAPKIQEQARKSHYFHGRYENIYIESTLLRGIDELRHFWNLCAADVLELNPDELKNGFWFNLMAPGQRTTLHSHDDDDELLSGVYYLQVPPGNSGTLVLHHASQRFEVEPEEGKLVLFAPDCLHEVTENQTPLPRLSIGINFGRL